jgi:CRISPR-associated protein Cpf1
MRNSIIKGTDWYNEKIKNSDDDKIVRDMDYLISPIADSNGNFFDSRKNKNNLPDNTDANGAYNIARKGLLMLKRVEESTDKKINLFISQKEWLNFAQDKNNNLKNQ